MIRPEPGPPLVERPQHAPAAESAMAASAAEPGVDDSAAEPATGKASPASAAALTRPESPPQDRRPRATRVSDGAWLGGVCTGLARHLGWPLMAIRIGFVLLAITQFLGVVVYAALWLLMPPASLTESPGLESHERTGMRPKAARPKRRVDIGAIVALCAIGAGMLWLVQLTGLGLEWRIFWPIVFACIGGALLWRQADATQQRQIEQETGGRPWLAPLVARGGWPALVRVVIGLGLVGSAMAMVVVLQGDLRLLPQVLLMTALALGGILIVVAPWLHRTRLTLAETRAAKVRADARADMAAHLHDSVLQTLALIQRQSADPKAVQQLARRQERELRTWLYGEQETARTIKTALTEAAADVEDERGVPIETVMVGGDCELTVDLAALVQAAREAMVNSAKHSGAATIDVYAELGEDTVEVFVRDRGAGFEPDAIPDDRLGVRRSIIDRMQRHGGRATIRSSPQTGTEVRLEMKR